MAWVSLMDDNKELYFIDLNLERVFILLMTFLLGNVFLGINDNLTEYFSL